MTITDAQRVLKAAYEADDTVLMEGLHGIGKSEVVSAFADAEGFHMETLFLSHQEVGDLIGMPRTIEREGEMLTAWTKPIWLQRMDKAAEEGKPTVLFLDELNRAPIDVRQTALQLVLERQIHEHMLPESNGRKSLIVAAINPADEYQVDELDPALLDRFLTLEVEVDTKSWLDWSLKAGVNQIVRDFIVDNPKKLHWTPAEQDGKMSIGATPRSWTKLAKFIDNVDHIPGDILFPIIKGKVGAEIGSQFLSFLKNYVDIIKMEDIETLVEKMLNKTTNVEKLGEAVKKLTSKMEAIQKRDMIDQMNEKYLGDSDKNAEDCLPFMAMLYSVEVEILNAYLKSLRANSKEQYTKLAQVDKELNNKKLFYKVTEAFV